MKHNFYTQIHRFVSRRKQQSKVWLRSYEINRYFATVIWVLRMGEHEEPLNFTRNRIKFLLQKSGKKFTHLYLKECVRLLIRYLAGQGEAKYSGNGILVSRDWRGIPHIISSKIRNNLGTERMLVVTLLTLLCIYRLIDYKVKPDLGTITKSFTGKLVTLPVNLALYDLLGISTTVKLSNARLIMLESAGPNAVKSAWSASIDALAFIHEPRTLWYLFLYNWKCGNLFLILWILALNVIASPLYLVFLLFKDLKKLHLGKLAVVRDVAGKARVVAITNWWIQASLRPLHDGLFALLKRIPQDGTFNQEAPLDLLIKRTPKDQTFYSFDLSAATDRLPLDVQRDIINHLNPVLGTIWFNLIKSMKYFYNGCYVKYTVGQPMGAYSSFAMLALTHHTIIRYAALQAGIHDFRSYAVLGDDVVIANDAVASNYLVVMSDLGVSINMSKSVVSKDIAEFAKKWKGLGVDYSPIGPGLILQACRSKTFLAPLLSELFRLELLDTKALLELTSSISRKNLDLLQLILWSALGLGSWLQKSQRDANAILWAFSSASNLPLFQYSLWNSLLEIQLEDYRKGLIKLQEEATYFHQNWWRTYSCRSWPLRVLEFTLKLFGPGFWIYGLSFERAIEESSSIDPVGAYRTGSWEDIYNLGSLVVYLGQSTIDWRKQEHVRKLANNVKRLNLYFERSRDEARLHFG